MALTVTSRGTGTHNTGATTLVPNGRSATLAVGSLGVLCIALDNAGSAGSATCAPSSWTDAKGNIWTRRQNALFDNGAASAGIEMAIYTAPITVALLTTDAGTMTWDGGVSPVAKAWTWYEVIPSANAEAVYLTGGTIAGATAANAQVVTASIAVGDAVIAGYFSENVAAVTGDSDSTNGSWAAQQTTTVGSTTSGVRIATQQKVQTTTPSTQSYDVTVSSQDRIAGYIAIHEQHTANSSIAALTGGGVIGPTETTARSRSAAVATGGGVETLAKVTARSRSAVLATGGGVESVAQATARARAAAFGTGGGVSSVVGQASRRAAPSATGAGVLTVDYATHSVENHDGTFTGTAGGVETITAAAGRASTFAAAGGGIASTAIVTNRLVAPGSTGGGISVLAAAPARGGSLTVTGAGAVSASVLAARQLALLLSGGGVIATDVRSARATAWAATSGGVADIRTATGEDHEGTFAATAGGSAFVVISSQRLVAVAAIGGGVLEGDHESSRLAELVITAGGAASLGQSTDRPATFAPTGGGVPSITALVGTRPHALPDETTATVGLSATPTASVVLSARPAPAALAPEITAEVTA